MRSGGDGTHVGHWLESQPVTPESEIKGLLGSLRLVRGVGVTLSHFGARAPPLHTHVQGVCLENWNDAQEKAEIRFLPNWISQNCTLIQNLILDKELNTEKSHFPGWLSPLSLSPLPTSFQVNHGGKGEQQGKSNVVI